MPDNKEVLNNEEMRKLASYVGLAELFIGLCLLGFAFESLANQFAAFYGRPLNPDVPTYLSGAQEMVFFWDSGLREPLQVFFFRIGYLFSSDGEYIARLVTTVQTMGLLFIVWGLARSYLGRAFGIVALYLVSTNPIIIYYGPSGMRAPLYTMIILILTWCLFSAWSTQRWKIKAVTIGLILGALILTRALAFPICVGALILFYLYFREKRNGLEPALAGTAALSLLIACILYLPHFFLRESSIGNNATAFFRNFEQTGRAHYSPETSNVSFFEWIFLEHSPTWIIEKIFGNTFLFFTDYLPHFFRGYEPLVFLVPAAMLFSFLNRQWPLTFMCLFALAPVLFILHFDPQPGMTGVESRFVYPTYPLALFLMLNCWLQLTHTIATLKKPQSLLFHSMFALLFSRSDTFLPRPCQTPKLSRRHPSISPPL